MSATTVQNYIDEDGKPVDTNDREALIKYIELLKDQINELQDDLEMEMERNYEAKCRKIIVDKTDIAEYFKRQFVDLLWEIGYVVVDKKDAIAKRKKIKLEKKDANSRQK